MKKRLTKVLSLMMAMFVAAGMTCSVFAIEADPNNLVLEFDASTIYVGQDWWGLHLYDDADYDDDADKPSLSYTVTSSNPKVVSVKKTNYGWWNYAGKSAGKATLTVKYNYGGKTGTFTRAVTVKNNPKALKSLKINGKKAKLKKNKWLFKKKIKKSAKSVKIKAKPAKGWKVTRVTGWAYTKGYNSEKVIKISKKAVSKGKNIKLAKKYKYFYVHVSLYNKSKKEGMTYEIAFQR